MIRALLIDDEPAGCEALRALLRDHPQIEVIGEAGTVNEGRAALTTLAYDLVFLDIQLIGGSGFDLVPHVAPGARIIFVSAFDRFALRAFEVNALDYLQKPVLAARLQETLRRVAAAAAAHLAPPRTAPPLVASDLVQVKTGPGAARFVRLAEIATITSQDNYTELQLAGGDRLLVRQTLANWEDRLPATDFLRVHRRTIVNLRFVRGYTHEDDDVSLLRIEHVAEPVRARRHLWPELTTRLAALGVKL